jgi:hypothetical protein
VGLRHLGRNGTSLDDVVWAKLKAMADGAKIASQRLGLG